MLEKEKLGLDTEAFGLDWDDKLFSLIIGDDLEQFYFNFDYTPDHLGNVPNNRYILGKGQVVQALEPLFFSTNILWFIHNAKYDMRRLDIEGVILQGEIHDTEVVARILRNDYLKYSLEEVGLRHGFEKDMRVEEYIAKHKLYTMVEQPGKKTKVKNKHYDQVPFDIISPYGCRDVQVCYSVGMEQLDALREREKIN